MQNQSQLRQQAGKAHQATAIAHPNIAFIKYWGNQDDALRLPVNPSLSMNLGDLHTITNVQFDNKLPVDMVVINGQPLPMNSPALERVTSQLDLIRRSAKLWLRAKIDSSSNFPVGAGIASSASAFAALTVAAAAAAGLDLDEATLSRLARRGSGSASRSVPMGFCQWLTGDDDSSIASSIAPPNHWELRDVVAIVSAAHKTVGSTGGHPLAATSPLQAVRVATATDRFNVCREAILARDLATLGTVMEEDAVIMHAVMMTSRPPLYYWNAATMSVIHAVQQWRADGLPVYFTIDAGPNVHLICEAAHAETVMAQARQLPGVSDVLVSGVGGPARLVEM